MSTATVENPTAIQTELESKRALPRALVAGTEAMRAAAKTYLPKHPAEAEEDYKTRLAVSVLLPAYRDAIDLACGLIFRKPVTEGEGFAAIAKPWMEDIDRAGRNITQFAESVLRDAFDGVSYIVADYPRVPMGLSALQERTLGVRPYLIHVKASQVLGWRTQQVNGSMMLTQFRYLETSTEPDGAFGSKTVQRIRVLEPGMVTVYVKYDTGGWMLDPDQSGIVSLKEVPVVACYTGRTGFMEGIPPLLDLAFKNVQHWQADSDLQSIIHKTCCPLLACIGFDADKVVVGPNNLISTNVLGAEVNWVELKGDSIPRAQANIETIKAEMQAMAGKILDKGVVKTATQAGIESTQAMSRIQAWALGLQAALNQAWALCGKWIGQDLGLLKVSSDVDTARPDAQFLTEIRNAVVAGLLTKETYLKILFNAEVLPEGFNIQTELDRLEREAPDLAPIPDRIPKPTE